MLFPQGNILIFAKQPVAGRVKTRLQRILTPCAAAEFARAGLLDTYRTASSIAPVVLAWDGERGSIPALDPPPKVERQSAGDLGQRMGAAFERSFADGAVWAIALGTDSPGLPIEALVEACRWLSRPSPPRAVLGPTRDGGYYLLGLSAWQPGLLDELPWSQPTTLCTTRARLNDEGYACLEVAKYFDVDEPDDLERLEALWRSGELSAPATAAWLARRFNDGRA